MKTSSIASTGLLLLLISGALICDILLAANYRLIDLNDPYKNFEELPVKPFTALSISGGNGYAVTIFQGDRFTVRVMNSRKSFFEMSVSGDTLKIRFAVANQTYQKPEDCVTGLIITAPSIPSMQLSGTNNMIGPFLQDSLCIMQDAKTHTRLNNSQFTKLMLAGKQQSVFDLQNGNETDSLTILLKDQASVLLHGISFKEFKPLLSDSATLVLYQGTLKKIH